MIDAVGGSSTGIAMCQKGGVTGPAREETSLDSVSTIGLDLAKSVFRMHGLDAEGRAVIRKQLRRRRAGWRR